MRAATSEKRRGQPLSKREFEVLSAIAEGLDNRQIGEVLFMAEATVKGVVSAVLAILGARNRAHAVAISYERAILPLGTHRAHVVRREVADRHASDCTLLRAPVCDCDGAP